MNIQSRNPGRTCILIWNDDEASTNNFLLTFILLRFSILFILNLVVFSMFFGRSENEVLIYLLMLYANSNQFALVPSSVKHDIDY